MNTKKSKKIAKEFKEKGKTEREVKTYVTEFDEKPEKIFPLLCPTREYDWIEHWECELIYSDSGYAEKNCVFKSTFFPPIGEEIWICSRYEKNKSIEFVRVAENLTTKFDISLSESNKKTTVEWTITFTGLNEESTKLVEYMMKESDGKFELLMKALVYYLKTGEMMKMPKN